MFYDKNETKKVKEKEDAEELELEHSKPVLFGGGVDLSFEGDAKFTGAAFFSCRTESSAPYMRSLGFPLREDSATTPKPAPPVAGRLTDQELTSYGFERRILKRLTEECKDFGAIYRCKIP